MGEDWIIPNMQNINKNAFDILKENSMLDPNVTYVINNPDDIEQTPTIYWNGNTETAPMVYRTYNGTCSPIYTSPSPYYTPTPNFDWCSPGYNGVFPEDRERADRKNRAKKSKNANIFLALKNGIKYKDKNKWVKATDCSLKYDQEKNEWYILGKTPTEEKHRFNIKMMDKGWWAI